MKSMSAKIMFSLLSVFVCIASYAQLQLATTTSNLNISSGTGTFSVTGFNQTASSVTVQSIHINNYEGLTITQDPAGEITVNGNTHSVYAAAGVVHGPFTVNPGQQFALEYTARAGCESVYEAGTQVVNNYTVTYANGTTAQVQSNPFSITWPRLSLGGQNIVLQNETEAELIIPIRNTTGAGSTNQIQFTITFPENARPLPQHMNPEISGNGTVWHTGIWAQSQSGNTYTFRYDAQQFSLVGLQQTLDGGETFFLKFPLQVNQNVQTAEIMYNVQYADSYNNFCEQQTTQGGATIIRNDGTPNLEISFHQLDSISVCDFEGEFQVVIINTGDGVAYISEFILAFYAGTIESITAPNGAMYPPLVMQKLPLLDYDIDGDGGFSDINNNGIYADIVPQDSVVLNIKYRLLGTNTPNYPGNIQFGHSISYQSFDERSFTKNVWFSESYGRIKFDFNGASVMLAEDNPIINSNCSNISTNNSNEYEYSIDAVFSRQNQILGEKEYFIRIIAPLGFKINDGNNVFETNNHVLTSREISFKESVTIVPDSSNICGFFDLICEIGYKQPHICGTEEYFLITPREYKRVYIQNNRINLDMQQNDIVISEVSLNRKSFGYIPETLNNIIPYKSVVEQIQPYTSADNINPCMITEGDLIEIMTQGSFHSLGSLNNIILTLDKNMFNQKFSYVGGILQLSNGEEINLPTPVINGDQFLFAIPVSDLNLVGMFDFTARIQFQTRNRVSVRMQNDMFVINSHLEVQHELFGDTCGVALEYTYVDKFLLIGGEHFGLCPFNFHTFNNTVTPYFPNEYKTNVFTNRLFIRRVEGASIKQEDVRVVLLPDNIEIPIQNFIEEDNRYSISFQEPLLIDFVNKQLQIHIIPQKVCMQNISGSKGIQFEFIDNNGIVTNSTSFSRTVRLPVIDISQPSLQIVENTSVSWNLTVREMGGASSGFNNFRWKSLHGLHLERVLVDNVEIPFQQNADTLFFTIPLQRNQVRNLTLEAQVTNCESDALLESILEMGITCSAIDFSEFDSIATPCYDRLLNAQTNNVALIPTIPIGPNQYTELCDTSSYGLIINKHATDISRISFWFDDIPNNVYIVNEEIEYAADSITGTHSIHDQLLQTPDNMFVSTTIISKSPLAVWNDILTRINFDMYIGCDPEQEFTDITNPLTLYLKRFDLCENPVEEKFIFRPLIKGFERLDSIKVFAEAEGFDSYGRGIITVTAQNIYSSLVDSVNITAQLPAGIAYVPNSTSVDYFDAITVSNNTIVWAFERGKHLAGHEELTFTFQVKNTLPCSADTAQIILTSSLEREVPSCDNPLEMCLVKATSDTAFVSLQRIPPQHIATIDYPHEICAGDSVLISVTRNTEDAVISYVIIPQDAGVMHNSYLVTDISFSGQLAVVITASNSDCTQDTTIHITVHPRERIEIQEVPVLEVGDSLVELIASPLGGEWSGPSVTNGFFDPSIGIGEYVLVYTYNDEGYCESKDSIRVRVIDCSPEIYVQDIYVVDTVRFVSVPVYITPIWDCEDCPEVYNIKFNVNSNPEILQFNSYTFLNSVVSEHNVHVYTTIIDTTIIFQLYGNVKNAFMQSGGILLHLIFEVQQAQNTAVSISNAYSNGFYIDDYMPDSQGEIIFIELPIVTVEDAEACEENSVVLQPIVSGNAPFTYMWSTGEITPSIEVSQSGIYEVFITDVNGYQASAFASVTIHAKPTISLPEEASFCSGGSVMLQPQVSLGTSPYSYTWNSNDNTYHDQNIEVSSAGTYIVQVVDARHCENVAQVVVVEEQNPEEPIISSPLDMQAYEVQNASILNQEVGVAYVWSGVTILSGQSSSFVEFTAEVLPAQLCVIAQRGNCVSQQTCVTINESVSQSIVGKQIICKDDVNFQWTYETYAVENPNAESTYQWAISNTSLAIFNGGNIGSTVNLRFLAGSGELTLSVTEIRNGIVIGTTHTLININLRPQRPQANIQGIQGWPGVCPFQEDVEYSISAPSQILWDVQELQGASIVSGQGTSSVRVNFGQASGNLAAFAQNGEGCRSYDATRIWIGTSNTDCLKSHIALESESNDDEVEASIETSIIVVRPQPASTIVYIDSDIPILSIALYTNTISLVATYSHVSYIDVSQLSSGVYYLYIQTEDNLVVKPLVVKK